MRYRLRTPMIVAIPAIAGMVAGYLLLPPDNRPMAGVEDTHRWAVIYGGVAGLFVGLALRLAFAPATLNRP